jgi:signal transduction histidine kinase
MADPHSPPHERARPLAGASTSPLRPSTTVPPVTAMALLMWQAAPQLQAVLDSDGRIAASNPAWQRLLGWDAAALRGRLLPSLVHGDDQAAARRWLQRVIDGAGPGSFTGRLRCADAHHLRLQWTAVLRDGLLCATGQPAADVDHVDAAGESPGAVQPVAASRQTLRGLARLTSGMSHEVNNLLQVLRNTLELIRQRPGEPRQVAGWAASALRFVDRGSDLTAQLVAFAGAQRLAPQTVAVAALLQGLRDRLQLLLGPRIALELDLPEQGGLASGDAAQLELAVLSLARNAADAMPRGGRLRIALGRVQVEEDAELATGEYVTIDIRDSGAGMTEAVRERAFEPFFTTRALGRGRGLGLSAVHGFLQQIGGAVRLLPAEPAGGRPGGPAAGQAAGQTVRLLLPAAVLPAPPVSAQGARPASSTQPAWQPRVLVVVDDADRRQLLLSALNLLGYGQVQAVDAAGAQALIDRAQPDVVVLGLPARPIGPDELARRARRQRPGVGVVRLDALATAPQVPLDMDALALAIARAAAPSAPLSP